MDLTAGYYPSWPDDPLSGSRREICSYDLSSVAPGRKRSVSERLFRVLPRCVQ